MVGVRFLRRLALSLVLLAALVNTAGAQTISPHGILVTGIDRLTSRTDIATYMQRVHDAGAAWVRTDFWWYSVEWVGPGVFDWTFFDDVLEEASARGLRVIPILWGTPTWAATDGVFSYGVPNMAAWEQFVFQTASRYKGRVVAWEVWNEPNLPFFWRGTPSQYAELLARAYTQMKLADPEAVVLLGGQAYGGGSVPNFLDQILSDPVYPAGHYFDVHNIHIAFVPMTTIASYIQDQARLLQQYGHATNIVMTELSYTSDPAYQNVTGYTDGEAGQARYLLDAYQTVLANQVLVTVWADLKDYTSDAGAYTDSGIVRTDLSAKQAFVAYQQMTQATPLPPPLSTGVSISGLSVTTNKTWATLSWTTHVPANITVEYGTTLSYGRVVSVGTLTTSHSVKLSSLKRRTTYYFRATSRASDGTSASVTGTFITK